MNKTVHHQHPKYQLYGINVIRAATTFWCAAFGFSDTAQVQFVCSN